MDNDHARALAQKRQQMQNADADAYKGRPPHLIPPGYRTDGVSGMRPRRLGPERDSNGKLRQQRV
jgi:hypothetical protein